MGCLAYVKQIASDNLKVRLDECKFIGHLKDIAGYYFYNPTEHKVVVSKHATLLGKEFLLEEFSRSKIDLE